MSNSLSPLVVSLEIHTAQDNAAEQREGKVDNMACYREITSRETTIFLSPNQTFLSVVIVSLHRVFLMQFTDAFNPSNAIGEAREANEARRTINYILILIRAQHIF